MWTNILVRMRTRASIAILAALVLVGAMLAQDRPGSLRPTGAAAGAPGPALDEIQGEHIAAHLKFLSDDLFEGRAPSTRGGQLAAQYLATQLRQLGYEPAGDDGTFFQNVPVVESIVDPSFTLSAGQGASFKYLDDVVAFSGLQDGRVRAEGEVVFVGHGIVAPELKWNDYAGVDMTGKSALIMVNDPPATADEPQLVAGDALTYYGRRTDRGILDPSDASATYPWQVVQSSWSGTQYSLPAASGAPALALKAWVTEAAARTIAKRAGQDLDRLRKAALVRGSKPVAFGIR